MLTQQTAPSHNTLLFSEACEDLDTLKADIAFLGIPYGAAYDQFAVSSEQSKFPDALRRATDRIVRGLDHYDFDIGGPLLDGRDIKMVDCGNAAGSPSDPTVHLKNAELAVRKIIKAGALPIVLGGDHSTPIPIFKALAELNKPITLIQVDAHLDWREEINGVSEGLSSPIRRASEMDHIGDIFQIGLRASGSARTAEYEAAKAYGANLITAREVHEQGMDAILARIPDGGNYYLTVDADGLDPSVMPAVLGPAFGGLLYPQMLTLIHGLVKKGRMVGMDVVEIAPDRDHNRRTVIAAGRLIFNLIGAAVRANYFK
ncbi:agmatinase [Agaricicola taiwanensis]|uniref:Agmatinase n=1 Tax=Agaricicola taiwanensis TaxID=591372 RepID=A0A8J2YN01_9RHOB|nr:agmatinase [Agaricicola taiwanensis]GGE53612.1 agmatinase [Agaricicola taiwanensis]